MPPKTLDLDADDDRTTRRRVSKKLSKKRKEDVQQPHRPTMELPDRFRTGNDEGDEDVLPPHQGPHMFMNMNQSIFGLIAAAGSTVNFNDRFESQSSDDEEGASETFERPDKGKARLKADGAALAQTQVLKKSSSDSKAKEGKHRRRLSAQLLRSLPQLPRLATKVRTKREGSKLKPQPETASAQDTSDGVASPASASKARTGLAPGADSPISLDREDDIPDRFARAAPVMSRMLEAKAEMQARPSFDLERLSSDLRRIEQSETGPTALSLRLMEIFEFDHPEEVVEGIYPGPSNHEADGGTVPLESTSNI